jgi:tRNA nucleotidyltransferase (CCA-adding enzyme)
MQEIDMLRSGVNLPLPPGLRRLLEAVRDAGGRPFLVGGAVRDALLGLGVKDYDVEVFGLPPEALEAVLSQAGRVNAVGEAFTVLKLSGLEGVEGDVDVSLPRRDSKAVPVIAGSWSGATPAFPWPKRLAGATSR